MTQGNINKALKVLTKETEELLYFNKEVPSIYFGDNNEEWPLKFYREHVSKNLPLVIKGGIKDAPATKNWTPKYFLDIIPDKEVTVAITPNGYADGINDFNETEGFFLPEERRMTMRNFLNILEKRKMY